MPKDKKILFRRLTIILYPQSKRYLIPVKHYSNISDEIVSNVIIAQKSVHFANVALNAIV